MAKQYTLTEFDSAGLSIVGPVREDNQDSILLPPSTAPSINGVLHAVADGMGGYANGGLASSLAIQNLLNIVRASQPTTPPDKTLKQAFETLNFEVYKASQRLDNVRMGTTLTAAYITGGALSLLHIGDSRAYLIRHGSASVLTRDHTVVGDLVRSKLLTPDRIRSHDQRSVLTRSVGLALFAQPDITRTPLQIGDRIVLCSDGVWSMVEDAEFAELSERNTEVQGLTDELVNLAVKRDTDDNCSVVSIQVRGFRYQTFEEPAGKDRGWRSFFSR